jgi:hypothetical protein
VSFDFITFSPETFYCRRHALYRTHGVLILVSFFPAAVAYRMELYCLDDRGLFGLPLFYLKKACFQEGPPSLCLDFFVLFCFVFCFLFCFFCDFDDFNDHFPTHFESENQTIMSTGTAGCMDHTARKRCD